MTSSAEFVAPRQNVVAALGRALSRDEFFAGLFILGCVNGLFGRMLYTFSLEGLPGLVSGMDMNLIVLFAFYAGVSAILAEATDTLRLSDLAVGFIFLLLVSLPIYPLSWVAVT